MLDKKELLPSEQFSVASFNIMLNGYASLVQKKHYQLYKFMLEHGVTIDFNCDHHFQQWLGMLRYYYQMIHYRPMAQLNFQNKINQLIMVIGLQTTPKEDLNGDIAWWHSKMILLHIYMKEDIKLPYHVFGVQKRCVAYDYAQGAPIKGCALDSYATYNDVLQTVIPVINRRRFRKKNRMNIAFTSFSDVVLYRKLMEGLQLEPSQIKQVDFNRESIYEKPDHIQNIIEEII